MFENHGEIINMRSALCQTVSPSGQYENDSPSLPTVIFLKNFDWECYNEKEKYLVFRLLSKVVKVG